MFGFLKQSTASQSRLVGPFLDDTDYKTTETALTIANTDVKLSKNGGVGADKNSGGGTHRNNGMYSLTFDATDTNTVGELTGSIDVSGALIVTFKFWVLEEDIYDALFGASAAGFDSNQRVDVGAVLGTAQTANDMSGDIDTILSRVIGTLAAGTHNPQTGDSFGRIGAAGAGLTAVPWNAAWDTEVQSECNDALVAFFTSAAKLVDDVWNEVLTGGTHNIANSSGRRLRQLAEAGNYSGGAIYIDTVNGTAGTTDYENGTEVLPVDSIADANTLAASLGISIFIVAPGSSITLAASQVNQRFIGHGWTLALGGQDVSGTQFHGADVSGTGTTPTGEVEFEHCHISGAITIGAAHFSDCGIAANITASAAGDYTFSHCYSEVAGAGTWIFDFGAAVLNTALSIRGYSGGIQIDNKDASGTDSMSIEGNGQLIVAASSGGAISLRGNFKVTNTGGATITYDDNSQGLIDLAAEVGTAGAGLTDLGGMSTAMQAEINTEVADVLKTDTIAEMAQQAPPATPTFEEAVMYLYMALRNKIDITSTLKEFHNDAGTVIYKKTLSDDGTTYSEAEGVTGP